MRSAVCNAEVQRAAMVCGAEQGIGEREGKYSCGSIQGDARRLTRREVEDAQGPAEAAAQPATHDAVICGFWPRRAAAPGLGWHHLKLCKCTDGAAKWWGNSEAPFIGRIGGSVIGCGGLTAWLLAQVLIVLRCYGPSTFTLKGLAHLGAEGEKGTG